MKILIKSVTGKTIIYNVEATMSIGELKSMLYAREGIPLDVLILFAGKYLEHERCLADYKIVNESYLILHPKLRGC